MGNTTFNFTPDDGFGNEAKFLVLSVRFGDGYTQDAGEGLNDRTRRLSLTFANRPWAELDVIIAFLDARGGFDSFNFTPPGAGTRAGKFVCTGYGTTSRSAQVGTLTCNFEERFTP